MEEETFDLDGEDLLCDNVEEASQGGVSYIDNILGNIFNSL